ncbi:MAG: hypothetical protein SWE60_16715 [Thermodesulfobacteriota bacterium]|nr:hypothetical protein [Thermodesulfobacteriota bacterium]
MTPEVLYQHLEDLLERVGISLVYDTLSDAEGRALSGLCTVKGSRLYIMDSTKGLTERIRLLRECLRQVDLNGVYLLPVVRAFLEKGGELHDG